MAIPIELIEPEETLDQDTTTTSIPIELLEEEPLPEELLQPITEKETIKEKFIDSSVGEWMGDMLLTLREYKDAKVEGYQETKEELTPELGVNAASNIALAEEVVKDVSNVGAKVGTALAQIPTDVASMATDAYAYLLEKGVANQRMMGSAEEKAAQQDSNSELAEVLRNTADRAAGYSDDIGRFSNDIKSRYLPALDEDEATDSVTDVASIFTGGMSQVTRSGISTATTKLGKAREIAQETIKEGREFATGAAVVSGTDAAFEPITSEMLGLEAGEPVSRRGVNFVEEAVLGGLGFLTLRGASAGAKQAYEYITGDKFIQETAEAVSENTDIVNDAIRQFEEEQLPPPAQTLLPAEQTPLTMDEQIDLWSKSTPLKDTRSEGQQYHGTSLKIEGLWEGHYSEQNYYGQGFYTTDAIDIARGYGKKGRGKDRTIYRISPKEEMNLLDMELPLSEDIKQVIGRVDFGDEILEENPKNLREVYDIFREYSSPDSGVSAYDIQEIFDELAYNFESMGYQGLQHRGGLRTNNDPHNVEIYFDPNSIEISEVNLEDFLKEEPEFDTTELPELDFGDEYFEELNQQAVDTLDTGGGGAGSPPDITRAFPYSNPDSNLPIPFGDRPAFTRGILTDHYDKYRDTTLEDGVALPTMRAALVDEWSTLHDIERSRRRAEGLSAKGGLTDSEWMIGKRISQNRAAWSRNALGGDVRSNNVYAFDDTGLLNEVDGIKNFRKILDDAADAGAAPQEVDELLQAADAIGDYHSIDFTMRSYANDMINIVQDSGVTDTDLAKEMGILFNRSFAAATADNDEVYQSILKEAVASQNKIKASLRKSDLSDSVIEELNTKMTNLLDETDHRSYLTRSQAEEQLAKYAEVPWSSQVMEDYSIFNKFMLQQRVAAGELSEEMANDWFKLRPTFVPSYKVITNATGTTSRSFSQRGTPDLKKKRKISQKENRLPIDTITEYVNQAGRTIEHARIRRNILDYFLNNFDDDLAPVFREPASKIRDAVEELRSGNRKTVTAEELLPYSNENVELAGDKIKFNIDGGTLELTIKDKDLYGLLARSSEGAQSIKGAWKAYSVLNDMVRVPVTALYTPAITIKELMDSPMMSNMPLLQRINPVNYLRGFAYKEIDNKAFFDIQQNYGMGTNAGILERLPGEETGESFRRRMIEKEQGSGLLEFLKDETSGRSTEVKPKGRSRVTQGFHDYLNRFDMMVRIAEIEGLMKQGYSRAEAMSIAKDRSLNFTQRGLGISTDQKRDLITLLEKEYKQARARGNKSEIIQARRNLIRIRGYVGAYTDGRTILFNNNFAQNFINSTAFARSFINSQDAMWSRYAWQRKKILPGIALSVAAGMSAEMAFNEDGTVEQFRRSDTSDQSFRRNWNFGPVTIPRGYVGQVTAVGQDAIAAIVQYAAGHKNDIVRNSVRDGLAAIDPDLPGAVDEYDPAGDNFYESLSDYVFNQFRFEPAILGPTSRLMTGKTAFDTDTVAPYLKGERPYKQTNSRTSQTMNLISEQMEKRFGRSFSPAEVEQFLDGVTGGVMKQLMFLSDSVLSYMEFTPEMRKLKKGEMYLIGTYLDSEQVAQDEWKTNQEYYAVSSHLESINRAHNALKKDYKEGIASDDEYNNFYAENAQLLEAYKVLEDNQENLSAWTKRSVAISKDVDNFYSTPQGKDRPILGSVTKTAGLDEIRRQRYSIMKESLDKIRAMPNGDTLIDERVGFTDTKSQMLVGLVNFIKDGFDEPIREPDENITPDSDYDPIPWEAFLDEDGNMPTAKPEYSITSGRLSAISETWGDTPEDIKKMAEVAGTQMDIDPRLMLSIAWAESDMRPRENDAGASSANGLLQITDPTWKAGVKRFGKQLGVTEDMRGNNMAEMLIGTAILREDIMKAKNMLNSNITPTEAYTLHHFGLTQGMDLIKMNRGVRSSTPINKVISTTAFNNNPNIVKDDDGNIRTTREVYLELQKRIYNKN